MKFPSSITPIRKIPWGHGQKISRHDEKEYNEDEEDMVF